MAHAVANMSREEDVRRIAEVVREHFGGFDTRMNHAGVSICGELTEVPVEDMCRLFEINVWGLIYGSRGAVAHLRTHGGALIDIGVLSDRAIPLQGIYSAGEHAVEGFTHALRMELEHAGAPVPVTLVKPATIDIPYPHHARNYLEAEPEHAPPVSAPEAVARTLLHAAAHPNRDVCVGGGARGLALLGSLAPRATDKVEEAICLEGSKSPQPPQPARRTA